MVMGGGDLWNPALQESALNEVGRLLSAGPRPPQGCETIAAALARDPYGIAYTAAQCVRKTQQVRAVPLAERDGMPYVEASRENMLNRTYPLVEGIYVYINRPPGKPVDPKTKEFLKYILSRHGQEDVLADGGYLPLPADVVAQELKKLE
jgi:phosphate transport system substrate-binding protein